MEPDWHNTILEGYEYQADHLAPPMARRHGSHSSMGSINSGYSNPLGQDLNFTIPLSPDSSYVGSPQSPSIEYANSQNSSYITQTPAYLLPAQQRLEVGVSPPLELPLFEVEASPPLELPLFDIEAQGDPEIKWYMYYDFRVTKNDAYWELQPGYKVTANYPSRMTSEKYKTYI
jgi:hypothetical protein